MRKRIITEEPKTPEKVSLLYWPIQFCKQKVINAPY